MARWCARARRLARPARQDDDEPRALTERQLDAGAWGITAANVAQVRVLRDVRGRAGAARERARRAGRAALGWPRSSPRDPRFDFYCLVDSVEAVRAHDRRGPPPGAAAAGARRARRAGGRTGARTLEEAEQVAAAPARLAGARARRRRGLRGHRCTATSGAREVDEFLDRLAVLVRPDATSTGATRSSSPPAAARYFDRVAERAAPASGAPRAAQRLLRDPRLGHLRARLAARRAGRGTAAAPALEVWGAVLSRPEPELALLAHGQARRAVRRRACRSRCAVRDRDGLRAVDGMR